MAKEALTRSASVWNADPGFLAVALGQLQDRLDERSAADHRGLGIAGDRSGAERGAIDMGDLACSAWARGSVPLWSGSPGRGGVSAKSGGTTKGALRATANSSGRARLNGPPPAQPASVAAAERARTK